MSMITATTWVPRGFAAAFPTRYELNEDEFARIATLAKLQLDDAKDDLEEAREGVEKDSDAPKPRKAAGSRSAEYVGHSQGSDQLS